MIRLTGRPAYGVPLAVLAAHQATPDQRAAFDARMSDLDGYRLAPDQPLYLPSEEALEAYRLSDEQRAALSSSAAGATTTDDAHGHYWPGALQDNYNPRQANQDPNYMPLQTTYTMNRFDPAIRSSLMAVYPR